MSDRPEIREAARTLSEHARRHWPRLIAVGIGVSDDGPALVYFYNHTKQGVLPQPEITEWQGWPVVMRKTGPIGLCADLVIIDDPLLGDSVSRAAADYG